MKKAETARYLPTAVSISWEASTNTSISIDLLLTNVRRPVTVTTQPWREEEYEKYIYTLKQYTGFWKKEYFIVIISHQTLSKYLNHVRTNLT